MQAEAVETELISIYHYFVTTYGFSAPIPYNNSSHYLIYIVDTGDVLISGGTMGQNDGGVTTTNPSNNTSQIYLHKNVVGGNSIMSLEEVLSHEFFHAIMSTYGYNYFYGEDYSWFKEGSADMAAKNYIGRSTSVFRGHVGSYLETCNQSIFVNSGTRAYGTSVYMDYIYQELGGWAAYKSILDNLSTSNDVYGAISNSSYISTYDAAFLAATTRTYAMDYYYGYQPMEGPVMDIETNTAGQRFFTLPPMAYKFYKIPGNSTVGTLTIECSVSNGTGLQVNVVKKNGTNSYTIATIAYDFTEIVYPVSNQRSRHQRCHLCQKSRMEQPL